MTYILEASEVIDKVIHLFGRDTETNAVRHFEIKDFHQYLFVKCRRDLQDCVSCYNEPVRKVIYKTPSEHAALIRRHRSTYDGDLRMDVQYLIERNIRYAFDEEMNPVDAGITPPRVCYYDIEVHSSDDEFPTPEAAAHPIVAISSKDSHTSAERIFTLRGNCKVCREHTRLPTEKALIEEWARWVAKYDFDILTGWYNLGFDWLYILNRAKKLKADISPLSRIPSVYPDEKGICGRTHVDMLEMFKVWAQSGGQLDSYDLKSISANPKFGDFAYADYGASIGALIEAGDWHTLVQYSLNDVKALSKIDAKCNLINFFEGLRRQTGIKFHQYSQKTRIIESLLYYEFHIPLPSRRVHERVAFEGAYVLKPTPGIKENVAATDIFSLYPSIIVGLNISPDAFSMIPRSIIKLMEERERLRAIRMETGDVSIALAEQAIKAINNSFYGAMGYPGFKLFDAEKVALIPKTGQEIIKGVQSFCTSLGYTVNYADTDSNYISPVYGIDEGITLQNNINKHLRDWATDNNVPIALAPKIKLEKLYKKMIFKAKIGSDEGAKKSYAGYYIWKDGKFEEGIDYVGIDVKRSDRAPITKSVMRDFFEKILKEDDTAGAIENVRVNYRAVMSGDVDVFDIGIPQGVKDIEANRPHARGSKNFESVFGRPLRKQQKPRLLMCKRPVKELCVDDSVTRSDLDKAYIEVDWSDMADRTIARKMKPLFDAIAKDWDKEIEMQRSLWEFM